MLFQATHCPNFRIPLCNNILPIIYLHRSASEGVNQIVNFIYLFSSVLSLHFYAGLSIVVESRGKPLVACGAQASHCGGFSLCAKAVSHSDFSICSSRL